MRKISIVVFLMFLTGCGSKVVQPISSGSKYAPVNEAQGNGVVYYLQDGADFVVSSRREDAYKKMYNQCNGKYLIVREWVNSEINSFGYSSGTATVNSYSGNASTQGASSTAQSNYRHIEFKCA